MNEDVSVSLRDILGPLVAHQRLVLGLAVCGAAAGGGVAVLLPRVYEASVMLATSGGSSSMGSLGPLAGAAAAIGGISLSNGELTPTPDLVSALLTSRRVLARAGAEPSVGGRTLVEALEGESVAVSEVPRHMAKYLRVQVDARTGLVTATARARDSGLARVLATSAVAEMRAMFADAVRSQARALREAQQERLDSASRQLAAAEGAYRHFLTQNRVVPEYSLAAAERASLNRALDVARQVFLQATMDREGAVARELQNTPVVVVVDPVPAVVPERERHVALVALLAALAGLAAGALGAFLRAPPPRAGMS